ncbi:hypothetical protein [Arcanobacterium phocae]|uniref:hypothetical protein n=2 Tax=Arcanobacterium phocae TaxID=131112 RepID=UPI001C0EDBB3|nr:hypothetical protein [Arcanobacterium phocae]
MHVMTKYLDTKKAAIAALQDYTLMEQIIDTTDDSIKEAYADASSPASPRMDGTPPSGDLHASENRIVASIERISAYKARYLQARQYMDWFLPAWEVIAEDDRFILEGFFLSEGTQDEKVSMIADHFYVERDTVYRRKNRALDRFATALYGQL